MTRNRHPMLDYESKRSVTSRDWLIVLTVLLIVGAVAGVAVLSFEPIPPPARPIAPPITSSPAR